MSFATSVRLSGLSVVSFLIARRLSLIFSKLGRKNMSWAKICMLLILINSWAFLFTSSFLFIDTRYNPAACSLGMFLCGVFYATSRVLIYAFLVEKVYIVWSNGCMIPRLKTTMYKICLLVQLGFVVLFGWHIAALSTIIGEKGGCSVEFEPSIAIAVVAYDFMQCLFFSFVFVWPLQRSSVMSPALRMVAKRTLIGAISGLAIFISSSAVAVILTEGHDFDSDYISISVVDVCLNALILYWVSSGAPSDSIRDFTLPQITITAGSTWEVDTIGTDSSHNGGGR